MEAVTRYAPFRENGAKIRKARRLAGFLQEPFSERIGVSRRHMIRLEKGEHLPSSALRDRIVEATDGVVDGIQAHDDEDEDESASMSLDDLLRLRIRSVMREGAQ